MYIPAAFAESDVAKLQDAIERYSFAILTSGAADGLMASHLPLLVDRTSGPHGTLLGHMARASGHWRAAAGQPVLALFSGPHAYISPRWYQAPQTVPTWNYVAVHAYGQLEVIEDEDAALELLQRTVRFYESPQTQPWELNELPQFVEKLVRQIVAFRIPIERLEGKWKLNQNRPSEQRARVIDELSRQATDDARAIAELMRGFT
jgi:transcriptional regulator